MRHRYLPRKYAATSAASWAVRPSCAALIIKLRRWSAVFVFTRAAGTICVSPPALRMSRGSLSLSTRPSIIVPSLVSTRVPANPCAMSASGSMMLRSSASVVCVRPKVVRSGP